MIGALTCLCRTATAFASDGALDEKAQAGFLARLADQGIGLYLGSGGLGEGHALSLDELRRLYRIGCEVGRGRVQVNANPPEQYTVDAMIAHARVAIECGVDVINVYVPAGLHGYKASDAEILRFYDEVLKEIRHPVALGPGPVVGYSPKVGVVAELCRRHSQIVAVNLAGLGDNYFVRLKRELRPGVEIYVPYTGSLNTLGMGAAGDYWDRRPTSSRARSGAIWTSTLPAIWRRSAAPMRRSGCSVTMYRNGIRAARAG